VKEIQRIGLKILLQKKSTAIIEIDTLIEVVKPNCQM